MATGTAYERAAYGNYVFGAYMSAGGWPTLSLPPNPPRLPHPSRLSKGGNANPNARRRYAVSIQYRFLPGTLILCAAQRMESISAEVKTVPPLPIYRQRAAGSPLLLSKQWFSAPRETRKHRFPLPFHAFTDTIRILLYVQHHQYKMFHVEHCRDWWLKPVTEAGKFRQGDPKPQRGSPDPSNPSTTPYASPNAASSADGSFPPASARSGRPPPLPPTRWATGPITLPA